MTEQEFDYINHNHVDFLQEARKSVIIRAAEIAKFHQDYERAEQILRTELYDIDFKEHQRTIGFYSEMSKMANEDPQIKKIWDKHSPELLEIIEGRKKTLLGFEELISPMLLRLKKLSKGE